MKKFYKSSSTWPSYILPQVLKDRGVDDPEKLPNFHYREDSLKLWAAIADFVKEILSGYYHSDGEVQKVIIWVKYLIERSTGLIILKGVGWLLKKVVKWRSKKATNLQNLKLFELSFLSTLHHVVQHRRRNIECFRWLFLDVNQFPQDSKNQRRSKKQLLLSLYDEVVK